VAHHVNGIVGAEARRRMISQLIKVDDATWKQMKLAGRHSLPGIGEEWNLRILKFDPDLFTHVYLLLGQNPARSGHDLTYYLATVNGFFDRNEGLRQLRLIGLATDIRKRLSEDLAVAVASVFMHDCFDVDWRSIAQIPANNALSRKRPDFEGFCGEERHLWESKGVSAPGGAEDALGKATEQVKGYPEPSLSKLAIVSYFSHDPRLFESSTFVVDPELPDVVLPDRETAQLLHIENVLQFAGLAKSASVYMKTLARYLKARRPGEESDSFGYLREPSVGDRALRFALKEERGRLQEREVQDRKFTGRRLTARVGGEENVFWLGVRSDLLDVVPSIPGLVQFVDELDSVTAADDGFSALSDATVLIRERRRG
jgi:hypothetical protein